MSFVKAESDVPYRKTSRLFGSFQFAASKIKHKLSSSFLNDSRPVLKLMLGGTLLVASLMLIVLVVSFLVGRTYVADRLPAAALLFAYLFIAVFLMYKRYYTVVSWMLIAFYTLLASIIFVRWGINTTFGILVLSFVILLAGVIISVRTIIPVAIGAIGLLLAVQFATSSGVILPDYSALAAEPTLFDVASYGIIFFIFALVSWLSGRKMEQSLQKALKAEAALAREKELLAIKLEERTRKLQESQLEETRQLYRFAELGQLSTVLLHELANHLSVLTLDIDDIEQRHRRSEAVMRAKESIGYLDDMVTQVRHQLREDDAQKEFNVTELLDDAVTSLRTKAEKSQVDISFKSVHYKKPLLVWGDALRLSQVVMILVTNAIEAYAGMDKISQTLQVLIEVKTEKTYVKITVTDWGMGIPKSVRKRLFEPFQTSKPSGNGIGLFVAKKMIETHFRGTISIDPRTDYTKFIIKIPLYNR